MFSAARAAKMPTGLGLQLWLEGNHCQSLRGVGQSHSDPHGRKYRREHPCIFLFLITNNSDCHCGNTVVSRVAFCLLSWPCCLLPVRFGADNPLFLGLIYKVLGLLYSLDELIQVHRTVLERAPTRSLASCISCISWDSPERRMLSSV